MEQLPTLVTFFGGEVCMERLPTFVTQGEYGKMWHLQTITLRLETVSSIVA